MNIKLAQLQSHLHQGLASMYLLTGDEPLQLMESCDQIRAVARQQGYLERNSYQVEKSFDWSALYAATQNMSLFSQLRIVELRIGSGKLGEKGNKALLELIEDPPPDTLLLVIADKLEKATQNSKWYKRLSENGVVLQIWPVELQQLPAWILQRAKHKGVNIGMDAAQLLAQSSEGNLLASAQEIDKLQLVYPDSSAVIGVDQVQEVISDNARFDMFGLVDVCLSGDGRRATRMLQGLRAEGAEPVLILWAFTREIRSMLHMAERLQQGMDLQRVLTEARVWPKRKSMTSTCLRRSSLAEWEALLLRAGRIDRLIKGLGTGNVWDQLLQLALAMAGSAVLASSVPALLAAEI